MSKRVVGRDAGKGISMNSTRTLKSCSDNDELFVIIRTNLSRGVAAMGLPPSRKIKVISGLEEARDFVHKYLEGRNVLRDEIEEDNYVLFKTKQSGGELHRIEILSAEDWEDD